MSDQSRYEDELINAGFTQEEASAIVRIMINIHGAKDTQDYSHEFEDKMIESDAA